MTHLLWDPMLKKVGATIFVSSVCNNTFYQKKTKTDLLCKKIQALQRASNLTDLSHQNPKFMNFSVSHEGAKKFNILYTCILKKKNYFSRVRSNSVAQVVREWTLRGLKLHGNRFEDILGFTCVFEYTTLQRFGNTRAHHDVLFILSVTGSNR